MPPIRVGIIGANPERGWALSAHIPALRAMPAFRIAAVSTTRLESASETARRFDVPHAYGDWRELVADPDVDVVAICVKVPHHRELVLGAIAAGKHVLCEWPLGLTTAEAEEMQQAATACGVLNFVGLQGRTSPALTAIRDLVAAGTIGPVISATLNVSLANSGPRLLPDEIYRTQRDSGATALTVSTGHSLDSLCYCLGEFTEISALATTQHRLLEVIGTGQTIEATAPDQVLVTGRLESGAAVSVQVKANIANPTGVLFEINGMDGDIVATTRRPVGRTPVGIQRADLQIMVARGRTGAYVEFTDFAPEHAAMVANVPPGPPTYTAQLYARLADALTRGLPAEPDFAAAVRRHRLLDAVETASSTGMLQRFTPWPPISAPAEFR